MNIDKIKNFMDALRIIRNNSSCVRGKVAAMILDADGFVLSVGYNGTPKGSANCEGFCQKSKESIERNECSSVHAEQNALIRLGSWQLAKILLTTTEPCWACMKMICNTNIDTIYYSDIYPRDDRERRVEYWVKAGRKIENYVHI